MPTELLKIPRLARITSRPSRTLILVFSRIATRSPAPRGVGGGNVGARLLPSYQVTREGRVSTRGRARLLFEIMNGEVLIDGWNKPVSSCRTILMAKKIVSFNSS